LHSSASSRQAYHIHTSLLIDLQPTLIAYLVLMTHESSFCAVLDGIRQMLEYTDNSVTRNASEKKINSLLDFISASSDLDLLQV